MSDEKKVEEQVVTSQTMNVVLPDTDLPVITIKKLLTAGAHFGHQTRLWNPKMKPYIYGERNGVHIIKLEKTIECTERAYAKLKDSVTHGGKVLFVGTRKSHAEYVRQEAERCGSFYINYRWLGGTLTNFKTILTRIRYLRELEMNEADGNFDHLGKKERAKLKKEMDRLSLNFSGIKEMRRVPEALVVTSPLYEDIAVKEAKKMGIPVFGLIDTNSDPDALEYGIPANDDASKTVLLFLQLMADAVAEAKGGITIVAHTPDYEGEDETIEDSLKKGENLGEKDEETRDSKRKVKTKHSDKPRAHRRSEDKEKAEKAEKTEQKADENVEVKVEVTEEAKAEVAPEAKPEVKKEKVTKAKAKKAETPKEEVKEETAKEEKETAKEGE